MTLESHASATVGTTDEKPPYQTAFNQHEKQTAATMSQTPSHVIPSSTDDHSEVPSSGMAANLDPTLESSIGGHPSLPHAESVNSTTSTGSTSSNGSSIFSLNASSPSPPTVASADASGSSTAPSSSPATSVAEPTSGTAVHSTTAAAAGAAELFSLDKPTAEEQAQLLRARAEEFAKEEAEERLAATEGGEKDGKNHKGTSCHQVRAVTQPLHPIRRIFVGYHVNALSRTTLLLMCLLFYLILSVVCSVKTRNR